MSTTITYNNNNLATFNNGTKTLLTAGKYLEHNIVITDQCSPLPTLEYDWLLGYIQGGTWIYENPTQTYIDIYEVKADKSYFISLGGTVGSRFRAMFTTTDIRTVTSGRITGTRVDNDTNNPQPYTTKRFTTTEDGYLLVSKDNVGVSGLKTYVYNITDTWL